MDTDRPSGEITKTTSPNGHHSEPTVGLEPTPTETLFLSIVIPAYNEERRLPETLTRVTAWLEAQPYLSEVLIVDDGSEDGTRAVVERLITELGRGQAEGQPPRYRLRLLANEHRGKAYAVRSGMLGGVGQYILFSDADLSTPIDNAPRLLDRLKEGYDLAIGSREGQAAQRHDEPFYRHLMGRVFNLLVRLVTFSQFQDTQCGFKAFTRPAAQDLFGHVQLYGENSKRVQGAMVTGFDVEVLFLAAKRKYKVCEVPVQWYHVGGSKVNPVKDSLRMVGDILMVRLNDLRGLYRN